MTPAYQKILLTAFDMDRIVQAAAFISLYPAKTLNCRTVAQAVNISEHKLKAGFKIKYHTTVQQFIMQVRMRAALVLLQRTDLPVKTIAVYAGYKNRQYFITAFKKYYGQTPGWHRRKGCILKAE